MGEIKLLVYSKKPDIVCFTETWISHYEPRFIDYIPVWKHRDSFAGGLGILIRRNINFQNIDLNILQTGHLETLAIKVYIKNSNPITILNIYNPNKSITTNEFIYYLNQLGNKYIILGDYNAHTRILNSKCVNANFTGKSLEDLLTNFNICLNNPLDFYTYVSPTTGLASCLDVCCSSPDIAQSIKMQQLRDVGSDHTPISIDIEIEPIVTQIIFAKRFDTTNKESLNQFKSNFELSTNVEPISLDHLVADFTSRVVEASTKSFPIKGGKYDRKTTPWWNQTCADAVRERRRARTNLERHPTPTNVAIYRTASNRARAICIKSKKTSIREYISEIQYDTPIGEVHQKFKTFNRNYVPHTYPLVKNNILLTDSKEKANFLAEYYHSSAKAKPISNIKEVKEKIQQSKNEENSNNLDYNRDFTMNELESSLRQIKNTSPGMDGITYSILKALPPYGYEELLNIYNQSFSLTSCPAEWKLGIISPIPKPYKMPEVRESYRQITLLSCIGKTFERMIKTRLEYETENRGILNQAQTGFRKNMSTIDILLRIEHQIRNSLEKQEVTLVVYLDLQSAFDTVCHTRLLYKLCCMGFQGRMVAWLESYLGDRKSVVRVEGHFSDETSIEAGVPQGAILSPLLFNLMISDIPSHPDITLHIYADDITIVCSKSTTKETKEILQKYLNDLSRWCDEWGLTISPSKTFMQMYTRKRISSPILRINQNVIQYKREIRLLGLIFDSPLLSWKAHIEDTRINCIKRMNCLKSLASTNYGASFKMLRLFHISYIRAKADYGSIMFAGANPGLLRKLETLQNSCIRLIIGARNTSPILSIQAEAHLPPLTLRRVYLGIKQYIRLQYKPTNDRTVEILELEKAQRSPFGSFMNRVKIDIALLEIKIKRTPTANITKIPPWITFNKYVELSDISHSPQTEPEFNQQMQMYYSNYYQVFTDGSKVTSPNESTSSAIYIPHKKIIKCWKLHPNHSVISAELFAINSALIWIGENNSDNDNYIILTDSYSSLQILNNNSTKYIDIVETIKDKLRQINSNYKLIITWVRSHCGIKGNEIADRAASLGHENDRSEMFPLAREECYSILRNKFIEYWDTYWQTSIEISDKGRHLKQFRNSISDLVPITFRNRREQVVINRMRIGHVGVITYLHRFGMSDTEMCSTCMVPDNIEHFLLYCQKYSNHRMNLFSAIRDLTRDQIDIQLLLGAKPSPKRHKILQKTATYIKDTGQLNNL